MNENKKLNWYKNLFWKFLSIKKVWFWLIERKWFCKKMDIDYDKKVWNISKHPAEPPLNN